jgi:hypothetical protein
VTQWLDRYEGEGIEALLQDRERSGRPREITPDHEAEIVCKTLEDEPPNATHWPLLPLGLGYVEGVTHDYIRHGTTTLFAALDVASGQVMSHCSPRHRQQEFLQDCIAIPGDAG